MNAKLDNEVSMFYVASKKVQI